MSRHPRKLRPLIALGLVALVEVALGVDCHYQRWQQVIAPLKQPAERAGEGLVIRGNGLGYYAWLRSLLIDHDWNFDNEFDEHPVPGDYVPPPTYRTELGRRANQWSVGPACLWALAVVPGHYVLKALGSGSPWAADGYSLPYQLLVGGTTLAMSLIGLAFLYGICRQYARPSRAALAAAFLTLGSTIVYYSAVEVSMAHGIGAACLAALVWYWLKSYGSPRLSRWLTVGALLGAATLARWQLATFAVLPAGEALLTWWRMRKDLGKWAARLALAGVGALAVFLPQMVAWRCVYGHWLVVPVPQVAHHWLTPSLWAVLLSQERSLFYWTPICGLACLGYVVCRPPARSEPMAVLFAAFALQVYALASLWGKGQGLSQVGNFAGVFLSKAYGMRHLTEAVVALAPGMAVLLERAPRVLFRVLCSLGVLLALLNLALVCEYYDGYLPAEAGIEPLALLATTLGWVKSEPWLGVALAEGLGLIALVLLWANQEPALEPDAGSDKQGQGRLAAVSVLRWCTLFVLLAGLLMLGLQSSAPCGFLDRVYRDPAGGEFKYVVFVPHGYREDRMYPLVLYLHGSGARGSDGVRPTQEGLGPVIREQEATFDMLALFPQSQTGSWDADCPDARRALRILDEVERTYRVDQDRVLLTGSSRGGFGVWSLAAAYPAEWAAMVPVCGGGNPRVAERIRHIPCWCFHGDRDDVVPVEQSRRMIEGLRSAGSRPRYEEYRGVGHNCWERAYRTPELFSWLRSQVRGR